jgi:hypothetical protein
MVDHRAGRANWCVRYLVCLEGAGGWGRRSLWRWPNRCNGDPSFRESILRCRWDANAPGRLLGARYRHSLVGFRRRARSSPAPSDRSRWTRCGPYRLGVHRMERKRLWPAGLRRGQYARGTPGRRGDAERLCSASGREFDERLILAMEAGERAGGDKRGRQSCAIRIWTEAPFPGFDLRVDDHADPLKELRRLWRLAHQGYVPFQAALPSRAQPAGHTDREAVYRMCAEYADAWNAKHPE